MTAASTCAKCGSQILASEPLALCAKCLLAAGIERSGAQGADASLHQTLAVAPGQVVVGPEIVSRFLGDYELLEELARGGMEIVAACPAWPSSYSSESVQNLRFGPFNQDMNWEWIAASLMMGAADNAATCARELL